MGLRCALVYAMRGDIMGLPCALVYGLPCALVYGLPCALVYDMRGDIMGLHLQTSD